MKTDEEIKIDKIREQAKQEEREKTRKEAIKWYNDLLKAIDNPKEDCPTVTWNYSIQFLRNWIKEFWKLTEEEIQEALGEENGIK